MQTILKDKLQELKSLCADLKVKRLYSFGSVNSDSFMKNSDIDFLISFFDNLTVDEYTENYFNLHYKLRELFNREIDIITEKTLSNPYLIESIDETLSLEILDENELPVSGISLTPDELQLTIPVSQQGGYRDIAVKEGVTGQVANLYSLTNISAFPPLITVYSTDTQLVNDLPGVIETEALDINGANEDISARLNLILPENISVVGDQSVLVKVSIEAILGSLTISDKTLEIINLNPALFAQPSPSSIDIIISGPLPILDEFSVDDLRVVVDVEELEAGEYQLVPTVEILNTAIKVESILPESIEITISKTPFSTPTVSP